MTNKGRTAQLRYFLSDFFRKHGVNAYYFEAEANAVYPYIVYELRHIGAILDSDCAKRYVMEINAYTESDISDPGNSLTELDNLLDYLESELSDLKVNMSDFFVWVNLAYNRFDIQTSSALKQKRASFEIKYYPKGAV